MSLLRCAWALVLPERIRTATIDIHSRKSPMTMMANHVVGTGMGEPEYGWYRLSRNGWRIYNRVTRGF